jgi:signal transduction histidine kinase
VRAAIAGLRDVAHGIYPAVLADLGLAPAVASLAEEGPAVFVVEAMPPGRLPVAVEATAYLVVAEAPVRTAAQHVRVRGEVADGRLRLRLVLDGVDAERVVDLTDLEDRIGALGGTLASSVVDNALVMEVDLPCVS